MLTKSPAPITKTKPLIPPEGEAPAPAKEPKQPKDPYSTSNPFYNHLREAGCNRREIKTLIYLLSQPAPRNRPEIQETTGMKQTDVSQATRALVERGWVVVSKEQEKAGEFKGGPKFSLFQLSITRERLCKDLEEVLDKRIKAINVHRDGIRKELGVARSMIPAKPVPVEKPHHAPDMSASTPQSGQSGQRFIETETREHNIT
jgi:predicted transcriptional regulator